MKKKHLWIIAAAVVLLIAAVLLFPAKKEDRTDEPFLIGQLLYSTTNEDAFSFVVARRAVAEAAGGELVTAEMSDTPESVISGVEDLIEMGCQGIVLTPVSNAILPQVMKLCDEAGVYWIVSMRPIHDASMFRTLAQSPYFLGTVSEDDTAAANQLIASLAELDVKTVATYSITNTNAVIEARELGIRQACAEHGIEILEELVNVSGDGILAESARELLNLHPDLDAIVSLSGSAVGRGVSLLNVLDENGSDVKFASYDSFTQWSDYYDQGTIVSAASGISTVDAVIATSLLVQAIEGTPVSEEAVQFTIPYAIVSNSKQLQVLDELSRNEFLAPQSIEALLREDVRLEDFQAYQEDCFALIP